MAGQVTPIRGGCLAAVVLAAALAGAAGLWWLGRDPPLPLPPVLGEAELLALPDVQLLASVATDLRVRLSGGSRWRTWPDPARHLLAWSYLEGDLPRPMPGPFPGFAALLGNRVADLPAYAEMAEAYRVLGAARPEAVLREAATLADGLGQAPAAGDPFAELDRRFLACCAAGGTAPAMRSYIRSHLAEIAAIR